MPTRLLLALPLFFALNASGDVSDPLHPKPHPTASDPDRFFTNRSGADLELPVEEDAFVFAVFGDRTGGPAEGIEVLRDAVADVNLIEPDFVITVGDLINGYNETPAWLMQMQEYKDSMDALLMPWFPVAGNHDVYWRGSGPKPEGEHEREYEMHFGPLWYAFEHKNSVFIVLYTDEGNPETGLKAFDRPESQRMSPEQFAWLQGILDQSRDARHVFVCLHHPRWLKGGYGNDWERVHAELVKAGNVRAVFAGHIHRMRYDGPRDGIEYVTLATVGGGQSSAVPEAGYLHHYDLVTVRDNQIAMASYPVGEAMDIRAITGTVNAEAGQLSQLAPNVTDPIMFNEDASVVDAFEIEITNPVSRPIEIAIVPRSDDSRWNMSPDHVHARIESGETATFRFDARRGPDAIDAAFRWPELELQVDYLAEHNRFHVPRKRHPVPVFGSLPEVMAADPNLVASFDGVDDAMSIPSKAIELPDGPLTLEAWFNADEFSGRRGLLAKTEGSEYGIFVSDGHPSFYLHLDGAYSQLEVPGVTMETGRWYHVAGVYDGKELRLYVDGRIVASGPASGTRTRNTLPLIVAADVGGGGAGTSFFDGFIDEVHLSSVARYDGDAFEPVDRHVPDDATILLLHMDALHGPWSPDASGSEANAMIHGQPTLQESVLPTP
jgi:hypothetical protein